MSIAHFVAVLSMLVLLAADVRAQLLVRAASAPPGEEAVTCQPDKKACVFSDVQGENTYTIDRDSLKRTAGGTQAYAIRLSEKNVKLLLAGANKTRTELVVVFEQASISTGALLSGNVAPESIQRQYTLSIRNPKSGEEIKAIDLGLFKPYSLALSATGDYVWVAGDELQLRRREVRAYNARSGKMEHSTPSDKHANIRLFERGFQIASNYYVGELPGVSGPIRKHSSPNAFSIAEFTVRRTAGIAPSDYSDAPIGVVGFQGTKTDLREMLEGALAIKLGSVGFRIVERQRLKDVLQEAQFQNLGLTDASKATELGRLVNAKYLLFGQLQTTGTVSSIALRLVNVEDGTLRNGIELECRDCAPDDYLQGLAYLIQDWVDPR